VPQRTTVRSEPLIAVRDVRASSRWYQQLLGLDALPEHSHRDVYDRLLCDGRLVLQLHAWGEHDHPNLVDRDAAAVERARASRAEIIQGPLFNPAPRHREVWLRDPDGYVVVVAGPDGQG